MTHTYGPRLLISAPLFRATLAIASLADIVVSHVIERPVSGPAGVPRPGRADGPLVGSSARVLGPGVRLRLHQRLT
jgi:hypothetical protein